MTQVVPDYFSFLYFLVLFLHISLDTKEKMSVLLSVSWWILFTELTVFQWFHGFSSEWYGRNLLSV